MKELLNLALVGCGNLGRVHAERIARIEGAAFVAYGDTHKPAADGLLAEYGGEYATDDLQKIWRDERIDAVYICTRHDSHASLCIAAAEAGKHVLVEKPLALTAEACERVAETVAETGVFLMPAFKIRYYPLIEKARQFIPQPQVLVGQVMDGRWPDDKWVQDPAQGGGNVHAQGCHMTDLLRHLADAEPEALGATGGSLTHPQHACIDQCVASIRFANGHVASWINGDAAVPPYVSKFFMELFGDGKSVQLYDRFKQATFFDGRQSWTEKRDEEEGFQRENEEFVAALRTGRAPGITAHDGVQATRMVLAADEAIRTERTQYLGAQNASPPHPLDS